MTTDSLRPARNNFWTNVELRTKSDAFLSTHILLSLTMFFSNYGAIFLKLRYGVIVSFRTKLLNESAGEVGH